MLYSFGRIRIINRCKTKSAVATAAYHSSSKMRNEWDGVTHDYRKKKDVGDSFIRMPENAPKRYTDESIPAAKRMEMLWNDVELFDKGFNAQLARQNYLALQDEFTLEQNLECVDRFIEENCTSVGMGVTYSVHLKPQNPHVDLMYLMREFDKDGNFKKKSQKQYLCRKDEEEKYLSAEEFKAVKKDGWEKIYRCVNAVGEEKNLTPSELDQAEGFERKSKYPLDRKVEINTWNDKELAKKWRKSWEIILNDKFKELGMKKRVDCRSNQERGMATVPTQHEGWGPGSAERKKENEEIRNYNKEVLSLGRMVVRAFKDIEQQIVELQEPQTEESLQQQIERLEENAGIANAVINAEDLLPDMQKSFFKERMKRLWDQVTRMIQKAWDRFKTPQTVKMEPKGLTLDDLIGNAVAQKKPAAEKGSQKNMDMERER